MEAEDAQSRLPPHLEALAETINKKFFSLHLEDAGPRLDPSPVPRLATHGADPPMASFKTTEHSDKNGSDRLFVHQLQEVVGRVRFGWSVAISLLSPIVLVVMFLIHTEWLSIPAKSSDLKVVQATLAAQGTTQTAQGEAIRAISASVMRLEESSKNQKEVLERIDKNLDQFLETILQMANQSQPPAISANTGAPNPPPSRRIPKAQKKPESGLFIFR